MSDKVGFRTKNCLREGHYTMIKKIILILHNVFRKFKKGTPTQFILLSLYYSDVKNRHKKKKENHSLSFMNIGQYLLHRNL